jgi:hypothetical protein
VKSPHYRSAFLLAAFLFSCSGWPGSAETAAHVAEEDTPASSASITIPGPLRSFLRMAAISQKVTPEEVLPLLAHNVAVMGYDPLGGRHAPTEYLTLLKRYVEQARELQTLAGAEGVIRISSCSQAQPLLTTLGYQLQGTCGPRASLETDDAKKAFLSVNSGFPLADLEQTLQGGKPFVHSFPGTRVPVLFSQTDWARKGKNKKDDVIDVLLHNAAIARLYWALARIDEDTRTLLRQSPGLEKLTPLAPVLDFYGAQIHVRSGRVVVPGGVSAESAWRDLVGARPDSPGEFVTRLLEKDDGWLAAYFDALSRASSTQQAYFIQPRRLHRFYMALRGTKTSPGPARGVFRVDPGPLFLVTRLQLEPTGQPHVPGNLEVWKEILGRKTRSKLVAEWAGRAKRWNDPEELVEGMFAYSREDTKDSPLQLYLALCEMDRQRTPKQRVSPRTVRLLAEKFSRFGDQYLVFSEFNALNNDSITRFLSATEAVDSIPDDGVRADALGIYQATVGLWQILARQGQIPAADWNQSWQQAIHPFTGIHSSVQLFDAARRAVGEVFQAATGRSRLSQDEINSLLAGPKETSPEGRQVRRELANKIQSVLDSQRLVSLDDLFRLGDGLNQVAQGKPVAETLLPLSAELREFELPKPLFSKEERIEWYNAPYATPHIQSELQTDLTTLIKSPRSASELAAAPGQLVPFLRDTLVGLNYAYYEPPGAQMLLNNPLLVHAHDFSGGKNPGEDQPWQSASLSGRGYAASGGAHLAGSLAGLPYVLSRVEQNFIAPNNVQSLIWEDLVPSLLASAVLPRWWRVTRNELHAVALYQQFGEERLAAAGENEKLLRTTMEILSDRLLPQESDKVERALRSGHPEAALSQLTPAETFELGVEFRRRFPEEIHNWGKTGQDLDVLAQRYPNEVSWERLSKDFGVPHPVLRQTYACELLNGKLFPTFRGYSSRLLAESWDSNNLYWARLADESGYPPVMLNLLVPELTRRMVENIFASHLDDWPALLRALRETGEEFRQGKVASFPDRRTASTL